MELILIFTAIILPFVLLLIFAYLVIIPHPKIKNKEYLNLKSEKLENDFFICNNNWLKKNNYGLWEMYVDGDAFKRGVVIGKLTKDLIYYQEKAFIAEIKKYIPSIFYLFFLKFFISWTNRNIHKHINKEFLLEIYGISFSASKKFSYVGPKYIRFLNYHAAHDIGHALQNNNFIAGCTSFAAWGNRSEDSSLIVGRNFDFYFGDDFAKDKIVFFCNPDNGYKFVIITWAGMIGAISGMNEKGLTITLNAAQSEINFKAKTPVSILAREILQFSKNINEAYTIAERTNIFVTTSILVGSNEDNNSIIIEKSPSKIGINSTNESYLVCSNHFSGSTFKEDKYNINNIKESSSKYRLEKVEELIKNYKKINIQNASSILRNRDGIENQNIGNGNEKAINQLIAHHSIIFKPSLLRFWISNGPFSLGEYICYDLKTIFDNYNKIHKNIDISNKEYNIPSDSFLLSDDYIKYLRFLELKKEYKLATEKKLILNYEDDDFINTNKEFYLVYSLLGDYYKKHKEFSKANNYYKTALTKVIPKLSEENRIKKNVMT